MKRDEIRELVRKHLETAAPAGAAPPAAAAPDQPVLDFLSARDVETAHREGRRVLHLSERAVLTPLARDAIESRRMSLVRVALASAAGAPPGRGSDAAPAPVRRVALGSDHGGYALKEVVKKKIRDLGFEVDDVGTHSSASVDYPDIAVRVARKVASGASQRGVVIDGAGIGSAMVCNKVAGVRAAHCHNLFEIDNSRQHNNANVLSLGAGVIGDALALAMVEKWLATPFAGGRHARRVEKIDALDGGRS